jgi:prepilin-type N-terminal cleavage/methylation domain-containing protein
MVAVTFCLRLDPEKTFLFFKAPMCNKGFTLLEILIALVLFSITLGLVYTLSSTVVSTTTHVEQQIIRGGQARRLIERIQEDLKGLIIHPDAGFTAREPLSSGNSQPFLSFGSTSQTRFSPDVIADTDVTIGYYLLDDERNPDSFTLVRTQKPLYPGMEPVLQEPAMALPLAEGLSFFQMSYQGAQDAVSEQWDSSADPDEEQVYPRAVYLSFSFADDSEGERSSAQYNAVVSLPPAELKFK